MLVVMPKDAEKTKARLLTAAREEFAQHGIAGARVDRIAAAATTNKQMIYQYFGNKDQLFDTVFSTYVAANLQLVDFDASDLPAYAGRMFDHFEKDPASLRLTTWYRLERPQGPGLAALIEVNHTRLKLLAAAQRKGLITKDLKPAALLVLIQALTISWSTINPDLGIDHPVPRTQRRAAVITGVQRIISPLPARPD